MSEKRVLQVVTGNFDTGGLSKIVFRWGMDLYNRDVVFDYMCRKYYPDNQYTRWIIEHGGLINTPNPQWNGNKNVIGIYQRTCKQLRTLDYSAVHVHSDTAYNMILCALAAKRSGINKIILHSHSTGIDRHSSKKLTVKYIFRKLLHNVCKPMLLFLGTEFCACSKKAANWMYRKKKVRIIDNGIEIEQFAFNDIVRNDFRKEQNLDGKLVIGHVGRFVYQKNHELILEIAKSLQKSISNCEVVLVGDGELFNQMKKRALEEKIWNIRFVGFSDDIASWMQAFDAFIMPSYFEGLPVVGIEAQAAGLPCLFSDLIDKDSAVLDSAKFITINEGSAPWEEQIKKVDISIDRNQQTMIMRNSKYNIYQSIIEVEKLYRA